MEKQSFEIRGGAPESVPNPEDRSEFDWHEFEPPWIKDLREAAKTDMKAEEQLKEKEVLMEAIAQLAKEEGMEFRGMDSNTSGSDLLAEEGVLRSESVEFHKKQERIWNSPLPLMISWGSEKGVITSEEARELYQWYKPEL